MLRSAVLTLAFLTCSAFAFASQAGEAEQLYDVLRIDELVDILKEEGLGHSRDIEATMFPGRGGRGWERLSGLIYDPDVMKRIFIDSFSAELDGDEVGPLLDFFSSERGRRVTQLEIEARRAFLDPVSENAAKLRAAELRAVNDPLIPLIDDFIAANDLIEANVIGGLNSNLAFFNGLIEGGGMEDEMDETQLLNLVWSQEREIRADTTEWLNGYLALAYQPLPTEDLKAYIALSKSWGGQKLNRALFSAYDALFERISYQLGLAASRFIKGQDI